MIIIQSNFPLALIPLVAQECHNMHLLEFFESGMDVITVCGFCSQREGTDKTGSRHLRLRVEPRKSGEVRPRCYRSWWQTACEPSVVSVHQSLEQQRSCFSRLQIDRLINEAGMSTLTSFQPAAPCEPIFGDGLLFLLMLPAQLCCRPVDSNGIRFRGSRQIYNNDLAPVRPGG